MSEPTPPPPMPDAEPAPAPKTSDAPVAAAQKMPRRWRRRIVWTLSVMVALILVFRIALALLLPTVINSVAGFYDLRVEYQRDELSILDGNARIWYLKVFDKDAKEPLLTADYVHGNLSILNLFRGRLEVWRCEADGATVFVQREKDGSIPLLEKFAAVSAKTPPPEAATGGDARLNLEPPLRLDQFRLNQVKAHLRDLSVEPNLDTRVSLDLRVTDVGATNAPAQFELIVAADPLLDSLRIEGVAVTTPSSIELTAGLKMRGLHLDAAEGYLRPLGLEPAVPYYAANAKAKISIAISPEPARTVSAKISLSDLELAANSISVARLESLEIDVTSVDLARAQIAQVVLTNATLKAERSREGKIRVAGINLVDAVNSSAPTTRPAEPELAPASVASGQSYAIDLRELKLINLAAEFSDFAANPDINVAFVVDEMTAKNIVMDPTKPDAAIEFAGSFHADGILRQMTLSGQAVPFAAKKSIDLRLAGEGLKPDAIDAYLAPLGVRCDLNDASFTARLAAALSMDSGGRLAAETLISDLKLTDGDDLGAMPAISVKGIVLDPGANLVRLGEVQLAGPSLRVRREANGAIAALGFIYDPSMVAAGVALAPARDGVPTTPSAAQLELPRLEIGTLAWKDVRLSFDDLATASGKHFELSNVGAELSDVVIDLESTEQGKPGKIKAWLAAPGIAEKLAVEGTVTQTPTGVNVDVTVDGSGLSTEQFADYLRPLSIESTLTNASIKLRAQVDLAQVGEGFSAGLMLENLTFTDSGAELAAVERLVVVGANVSATKIGIDSIELVKPRIVVSRDEQGGVRAAGLRIPPPPTSKPVEVEQIGETLFEPVTLSLPIEIDLKSFKLAEGSITLRDAMMSEPVETTATSTVSLTGLVLGRDAEPAKLVVDASATGLFTSARIDGLIFAHAAQQGVQLTVNATGVNGQAIRAYLPPGVAIGLTDGRFSGAVSANLSHHPAGGQSAKLSVDELNWQDGQTLMAKLDSLVLDLDRFDPDANEIVINQISVAGLEGDVYLSSEGVIKAFGLELGAATEAPVVAVAPATQPAEVVAAPTTAPAGSVDVAKLIARDRKPLPHIVVEKIDLQLKRFGLHLPLGDEPKPITLADFTLRNVGTIEAGGRDAESLPPVKLELLGKIDPLVRELKVVTEIAPLAQVPSLQIMLVTSGIQGAGVTELLPQLAESIDGTDLTDGQFRFDLRVDAKLAKRGPGQFDFTKPFEAELRLAGIEYRAAPDGEVLAGVKEVLGEQIRVEPATGSVRVRSLQILEPTGQVLRDADGLRVLGMLIRMPASGSPSLTTAPVEDESAAAEETSPPDDTTPAAPLPKPTAEIRIDQFVISGLSAKIEDRSVDPALILPLTSLDVEARNLSNWALHEPIPIRFDAAVGAGKVMVAKRFKGQGIAGLIGDAAKVVGGEQAPTTQVFEEKALFSQAGASGSIVLYPSMSGYVKAGIDGLQLQPLTGEAQSLAGVTLGGGSFDATVDVRLKGDDSADIKLKAITTELAMSEPENGLIARQFGAPLDLILAILTDPSGQLTLPIGFKVNLESVRRGKISPAQFAGPAMGAVTSVIGTAVASSPLKLLGAIGLDLGGKSPPSDVPPVDIAFESGLAYLDVNSEPAIQAMIEQMRKLPTLEVTIRHEMGLADVRRAELRANPTPEQCVQLAQQMRARKLELLRLRSQLAGAAQGQFAFAADEVDATLEALRAVDRELSMTEDALDELYNLLRPGAELQTPRRTRAAALLLARERIELVAARIRAAGLTNPKIKEISPQFNAGENETGKVILTGVNQKSDVKR